MTATDSPKTLADTVVALCATAGPARTIDPAEAAKTFAEARSRSPTRAGWSSIARANRPTPTRSAGSIGWARRATIEFTPPS